MNPVNLDDQNFTWLVLESYYGELEANQRYLKMADLAPSEEARRIVYMNAQDESRHAEAFEEIYEQLTGKEPPPDSTGMKTPQAGATFDELLQLQLFDEYADARKYKNMYLMTANPVYRDILFNAAQDELRHVLLDNYLLNY
ncbi:MAG: ferritin-like domain-containing protein [Peptococcaceae bacterium]|jgi:rubrerythrin|nr:ferritin-like domain-containing protein [Peptococcaceae bacterium]MDH7524390.1 ferritin-like domain-containing protein [Peptococcaceae bacterium]